MLITELYDYYDAHSTTHIIRLQIIFLTKIVFKSTYAIESTVKVIQLYC